jgi:hypothetical protein
MNSERSKKFQITKENYIHTRFIGIILSSRSDTEFITNWNRYEMMTCRNKAPEIEGAPTALWGMEMEINVIFR